MSTKFYYNISQYFAISLITWIKCILCSYTKVPDLYKGIGHLYKGIGHLYKGIVHLYNGISLFSSSLS